jgi:hypothetical protein
MTEQTMRVWAVTLSFAGGGPLILNTLAAPSAEAAAAMTMLGVCRMEVPAQELQGVGTSEMPADWLRWALKTIETGEPHKASVVSLVPSEPQPGNDPNMGLQSASAWSHCLLHGQAFFPSSCPECQRVRADMDRGQQENARQTNIRPEVS